MPLNLTELKKIGMIKEVPKDKPQSEKLTTKNINATRSVILKQNVIITLEQADNYSKKVGNPESKGYKKPVKRSSLKNQQINLLTIHAIF